MIASSAVVSGGSSSGLSSYGYNLMPANQVVGQIQAYAQLRAAQEAQRDQRNQASGVRVKLRRIPSAVCKKSASAGAA